MLINLDAKALEWVCAVWLSQDKVGMQEIINKEDIHQKNVDAFHLPKRLFAKKFLFRLIFGGSAYAYSVDPEFAEVGYSQERWQRVIDDTYRKYSGLARWHIQLVDTVVRTGKLVMPTGRQYVYSRDERGEWPRTTILNYPVQGLGADLMSIIRVSLWKRMKKRGFRALFICSVHDSILIDAPDDEVVEIIDMIWSVFDDLPRNFQRLWGVEFNLPLTVEVQIGENWGEMTEIKRGVTHADSNR